VAISSAPSSEGYERALAARLWLLYNAANFSAMVVSDRSIRRTLLSEQFTRTRSG
jgi:hypothetical protein